MIKRSKEDVIEELNKNVNKSGLLCWSLILVVILTIIFSINNLIDITIGIWICLYFLLMAICLLPKINRSKSDISNIKNDNTIKINGAILSIFQIKTDSKNSEWMIMVDSGNKEYVEIQIPVNVGEKLKEGDSIYVNITPVEKLVIELYLTKIIK